jgi:hypothetical protein
MNRAGSARSRATENDLQGLLASSGASGLIHSMRLHLSFHASID